MASSSARGKKCTRLRELRESAEDGGQVFLESSGQRPKETARSGKSIYLHDTGRGVQDHIVEGEQGWVLQGVGSFTCLISSITSERAEVLYSARSSYQQLLRQKERHRQEVHCESHRAL